ncbi:hypothetical protein D9M71_131630 [compost metagenome]
MDQALFVEAVTQTLLRLVRVIAQQAEQVVGAEEALQAGQRRVGLDQVFVAVARRGTGGHALHAHDALAEAGKVCLFAARGVAALATKAEQAVVAARQAEARQGDRIDLLLGKIRRQLWVNDDDGRLALASQPGIFDACDSATVGDTGVLQAIASAQCHIEANIAYRLDDRVGGATATAWGVLPDIAQQLVVEQTFRQVEQVVGIVMVLRVVRHMHGPVEVTVGIEITVQHERIGDWPRFHRALVQAADGIIPVVEDRGIGVIRHVVRLDVATDEAFDRTVGDPAGIEGAGANALSAADALVDEAVGLDGDIAGGSYRAGGVLHMSRGQAHIAARKDRGRGRVLLDFALVDLAGDVVDVIVIATAVVATHDDVARNQLLAQGISILGVLQFIAGNCKVSYRLEGGRAILHESCKGAQIIPGDIQIPQAVHIRIAVGEVIHPQRHIAATEDQSVLVEQVGRFEAQVPGAAQGAEVVQGGGADGEVGSSGDAAAVVQAVRRSDGCVGTAGDAGGVADFDGTGIEGEVAEAAEPAVAAVGATQVQLQAAVAGDQSVVVPVAARSGQALRAEQLAAVAQRADVQGQVARLQAAGVGPIRCGEGQRGVGDEAAAGQAQLRKVDAELAAANMQDGAAGVLQRAAFDRQVLRGGFQGAAGVVQQAAGDEGGGALLTEGAQAALAVVNGRGSQAQVVAGLDQALLVVQGTLEAEVDVLGADLAVPVEHILRSDMQCGAGIQAAALVIHRGVGGIDECVAADGGQMSALVGDTGGGRDLGAVALGDALGIVEVAGDDPE